MFKTTLITVLIVISGVVIGVVDAKFQVNRDVRFELHTREHSLESFEELRIDGYGRTNEDQTEQRTIFNASRPTRVFVHGYWSSRRAFLRYAKAFLNGDDCNFIAVNWLNGSKTYNYWKAKGRVERVSGVGILSSSYSYWDEDQLGYQILFGGIEIYTKHEDCSKQ